MPSRNVIKEYVSESYYHVYARGINKQKIFITTDDYRYFIQLFERYLSDKDPLIMTNTVYPHFKNELMLYSYCLMSNHFHLLVYQKNTDTLQKFMRSIMTSYSRYFNTKYRRTGPLFESRYKAVRIDSDSYLQHISRYIHLNPRYWESYKFSSYKSYKNNTAPDWLNTRRILAIFNSKAEYIAFHKDYAHYKDSQQEINHFLADK